MKHQGQTTSETISIFRSIIYFPVLNKVDDTVTSGKMLAFTPNPSLPCAAPDIIRLMTRRTVSGEPQWT